MTSHTKDELLAMDPKLSHICKQIKGNIPGCDAIILLGSRARDDVVQDLHISGDYDIAVVIATPWMLLNLRRFKAVEAQLSQELGERVSINPLPRFRITRASGNYFLFKLKREGVTLQGEDYLEMIPPFEVENISSDWFFFYIAFLMKEALIPFSLDFAIKGPLDEAQGRQLAYSAIKALSGCGELVLLQAGVYESTLDSVLSGFLRQQNEHPDSFKEQDLVEELRFALAAKKKGLQVDNPMELWFAARNRLLLTFMRLTEVLLGCRGRNLDESVEAYMKASQGKSRIKDFQYLASALIFRREIFPRVLVSRNLVDDRVRASLIWLLSSVGRDLTVDAGSLTHAFLLLKGHTSVKYTADPTAFWCHLKHVLLTYFPHACTALGV